jgi:hypothetical protein
MARNLRVFGRWYGDDSFGTVREEKLDYKAKSVGEENNRRTL